MKHQATYYAPDGRLLSEDEALINGRRLRDGVTMVSNMLMTDSAARVLGSDRITLADLDKAAELPKGLATEHEELLRPLAQRLRSVNRREDALALQHEIEVLHVETQAKMNSERQLAESGVYGPDAEARMAEQFRKTEAALAWLETVHNTLASISNSFRDSMNASWDAAISAAGMSTKQKATADAQDGWAAAGRSVGVKLR